MKELLNKETNILKSNEIIKSNINNSELNLILQLYKQGIDKVLEELSTKKKVLSEQYGHDIIGNITSRMKTPKSIYKKMKKKNLPMNFESLVDNINDIAGIRIVCNFTNDIFIIKEAISEIEGLFIIEEKNYINKPKKSGYSAYHLIVEVPININEQIIYVKAEIQIRTLLMDCWASAEHTIKYKTNKKLSKIDSRKLSTYAKIIKNIEKSIMKIYKKQTSKKIRVEN